ncbi:MULTISPECIES: hypothetical protein [Rhizobium]|uniref:Uncharacterized protein n=1 Tax=Rhizobium paranaense TaxID=1650438 RepID=A0A7W8XTJ0_9HYPH|nr:MULTISPECIES: hypothetical protein [Rhizobium]MBB5575338.1 hypothetical protein [Rhizobium paranaense]
MADATNHRGGVRASSAPKPGKLTFLALSPSIDAVHIHNAAIALPYANLEPVTAPPGTINEDTTTAVDPPDVPKTAVAEQPLALAAANPSASIEIGADADGDVRLCACDGRHGY